MAGKIQDALEFAVARHRGQIREGEAALPYVFHPIEVTSFVRHIGHITDEDLLCAALLHDTVEEGGALHEEIQQGFGEVTAGLVKELTRREPDQDETQGMTKEEIWELRSSILLAEIGVMSPAAQTIKLADRISNLREARYSKPPKKLERYLRQSQRILEIIPRSVNPSLWDALQAEITRP